MLPAHLALNIRQQILYYLQSTFDFRDRAENEALERFLLDKEQGLFKGPWLVAKRPYKPAPPRTPEMPVFFDFEVPFHPFIHQHRAWYRLTSRDGHKPQSTIVTTGTSSGKTECFLFPVLDHCLRMRRQGQQGIKAIVLYPMNALATDQEGRFAETIHRTPDLKRAGIRVGTYTGRYDPSEPGAGAASGTMAMGPDHGISNHGALQDSPPDILLTNYKMLDFLLMRPQDQPLWRFNKPGTLSYLVLDELHTYDGAQGADVACLIRRLKERLEIPRGGLCVVGTSATLESDNPARKSRDEFAEDKQETPKDRLARFASILFEEDVPVEAVLGEDRLSVVDVAPNAVAEPARWPTPAECVPTQDEDADRYVGRQAALWGGPPFAGPWDRKDAMRAWEVALGDWIKGLRLFRTLLEVGEEAEQKREDPLEWEVVIERMAARVPGLAQAGGLEQRSMVLASFLALVAQAREVRSNRAVPLLPTQVQLWVRELRRLGRVVSSTPRFAWLDEPVKSVESLPAWHCSECGGSGWMSMVDEKQDTMIGAKGVRGHALVKDPTAIYNGWFRGKAENERGGGHDHRCVLIVPWHPRMDAGRQLELATEHDYLCEKSLVLRKGDGPCPLTSDERRFRVVVNRDKIKKESGATVGDQKCPCCESSEGVFLIGSQAATLSSVAIDEMFGSPLNRDPKLLAFTDSVQDASHRAGFFTARTYRFTFRTALQHAIDESGAAGLPLVDAGRRVLEWAAEQKQGRPGNPCDALAVLMPADLQEYKAYREFRSQYRPGAAAPAGLWGEIAERLTWEATSEFGLMVTHGRTLEQSAASCLAWREEVVQGTLGHLLERVERVSPALLQVDRSVWLLWIYGMLHRFRLRGALDHPFLLDFARKGFWGKYPFGRIIPGRETFAPSGNYKPRLLVTRGQKGHDPVLTAGGGSRLPWHLVWTRRVLPVDGLEDATLLDLMRAFLAAGEKGGLLVRLADSAERQHYALSAAAALLTNETRCLECSGSNHLIVRPVSEAELWSNAPSMDYYEAQGRYRFVSPTRRQEYYQDRYHKGALRRVTAAEHTGLLATEERERLETEFGAAVRADDPNVLTCTSTLEMGINIGDLSSTMLCSIPPSTASYLQRIGRAGRATGTALIISVVNQKPHDLFFYARPSEMLKGRVLPPGCWLDATAVLSRQYLASCFDRGTHLGILKELPRTAGQLLEDLNKPQGQLPRLFAWVSENQVDLQARFLARFSGFDRVGQDTRKRFISDTGTERLLARVRSAVQEFDRVQRELRNSRDGLQRELGKLEQDEVEARQEIMQEMKLLKGRAVELSRTTSLELLTDHGLLPNYAFPERGVKFHGGVFNRHRVTDQEPFSVKVVRAAGVALRELAPSNTFYTHRRQFEIQQLAVGTKQDRLPEKWCICGKCGHMRRLEELRKVGAIPTCPQCGYEGTAEGQVDQQQQRDFLEFARSEALSFMEHYDSLSGDRKDERVRLQYALVKSFDQTVEAPAGAIVDEELPFGIEYREAMVLREVNGGFADRPGTIPFGRNQMAPEEGFQVCSDCGVVAGHGDRAGEADHRRHCARRRDNDRRAQKDQQPLPYRWERLYLYRELRSEAIRLLLPTLSEAEQETLTACLYLGLRLRFEGNPGHLIIAPQVVPQATRDVDRQHLVMMDSVPGGTGYLKSLYQDKDGDGREGEGIVKVLTLAKRGLVECECGRLQNLMNADDPDGCYRCIRSYHLQYRSDKISRSRGIRLLDVLIAAAGRRRPEKALDDVKAEALFESTLERQFISHLAEWVRSQGGSWETTSVRGKSGYRFRLLASPAWWEVELQPTVGAGDGVGIACRPDFMFRSEIPGLRPIAIFTDGFEFHCHPNNRLADDIAKRRALLESGAYWVWAITWKDLKEDGEPLQFLADDLIGVTERYLKSSQWKARHLQSFPPLRQGGLDQLKFFLLHPTEEGWADLAHFATQFRLIQNAGKVVSQGPLDEALAAWIRDGVWSSPALQEGGPWVATGDISPYVDLAAYIASQNVLGFDARAEARLLMRIETSDAAVAGADFETRWRRCLAAMNFFQFHTGVSFVHPADAEGVTDRWGTPTDATSLPPAWAEAAKSAVFIGAQLLRQLGTMGVARDWPAPMVEFEEGELAAELAWPDQGRRVAVLVGDQAYFAPHWIKAGWKVIEISEGRLPEERVLDELFRGTMGNQKWQS